MRLPVKKCLVVLDTNLIYSAQDSDESCKFSPKALFDDFLNIAQSETLNPLCTFVVPDIVVYEVAKQKSDENKTHLAKLLSEIDFFGIKKPSIPKYEIEQCYKEIKLFFVANGITVVPNPKKISSIIKRAVEKRKPFNYKKQEKTEKYDGSDKGFKDALFWHSILELENINEFENIFICTANKWDFSDELKKEFQLLVKQNVWATKLFILSSDNPFSSLKNELKNIEWKTNVRNWIEEKKQYILDYYNDMGAPRQIQDFSFNDADLKLADTELQNLVEVPIVFNTGDTDTLWYDLNAKDIGVEPIKNIEKEDVDE